MQQANRILLALAGGLFFTFAPAKAETTVECRSVNYQYTECSGGSLRQPQLIHQISSSPCILNNTWGYNPRSGYLWTSQGCSAVFADVAGYHYGRGDGYDPNARSYNDRGNDVGAVVGGAIIGALIEGMTKSGQSSHQHESSNHSYSNYHSNDYSSSRRSGGGQYSGCHGMGCLVDNPDGPPEPSTGQPTFSGPND